LHLDGAARQYVFMTKRGHARLKAFWLYPVLILLAFPSTGARAALPPQPAANADFDGYLQGVESRLARQHQSQEGFLAGVGPNGDTAGRLRRGEFIIENLGSGTTSKIPGAMLHHWRGTAFVQGARVTDFRRLMKDYNSYPQHFSPEVLRASLVSERNDQGVDHITASMRVRQKHVLTVVMDMTYDVAFTGLDAQHGYSISRSTRIAEIDSPGTSRERALGADEEHGFLWRLNTYWSYEEGDGGLYMQIETVSLTRSIPIGLGWAIKPFVESIPRESLEFTLRSACNLLRK
jgi:hypothetical protein